MVCPARSAGTLMGVMAIAVVITVCHGALRLALGLHFVPASVAAFEIWRRERGRRPTRPLSEGVEPAATRDLIRG